MASRNPTAKLVKAAREEVDLLSAPYQLYQIDLHGAVRTYDERVTLHEFNLFFKSRPEEYTVDALLAFAHDFRVR